MLKLIKRKAHYLIWIVQSTLCKSCFPLRGQPKGQKGKKRHFSSLCYQIFGHAVINPLRLIFFFQCVGSPILGQSVHKRQSFLKVKWRSYKPENYKGNCVDCMGLSPKMVAKGHNFWKVWIGLLYWKVYDYKCIENVWA